MFFALPITPAYVVGSITNLPLVANLEVGIANISPLAAPLPALSAILSPIVLGVKVGSILPAHVKNSWNNPGSLSIPNSSASAEKAPFLFILSSGVHNTSTKLSKFCAMFLFKLFIKAFPFAWTEDSYLPDNSSKVVSLRVKKSSMMLACAAVSISFFINDWFKSSNCWINFFLFSLSAGSSGW